MSCIRKEVALLDASFEAALLVAIWASVEEVLDIFVDVRSVMGRFASLAALAFGLLVGWC